MIKKNSLLSDVVLQHIETLPMIQRFGISLGFGSESIETICQDSGVEVSFFLHMLNSYIYPQYTGKLQLTEENTALMLVYLIRTNQYYLRGQLPNIEVHLNSFLKHSNHSNHILQTIPTVLESLKNTISKRVTYDEEYLFPKYKRLLESLGADIQKITLQNDSQAIEGIRENDEDRSDASYAMVNDVMQVIIRHIQGEYNANLMYGLLFSMSALREDLASNYRLRRQIFYPMLDKMERYGEGHC